MRIALVLPVGLELGDGVAGAVDVAAFSEGDAEAVAMTTAGDGRGCSGGGRGGVGSGSSSEIGSASQASVASPTKRPSGLASEANEGVTESPSDPKLVAISIKGAKCTAGAGAAGSSSGALDTMGVGGTASAGGGLGVVDAA